MSHLCGQVFLRKSSSMFNTNLALLLFHFFTAFKKKDFIYLLLARGREKKREKQSAKCEREMDQSIASCWRSGPQPRHCCDWESNQRPLGLQAGTQSTEPHQPGHVFLFLLASYLF